VTALAAACVLLVAGIGAGVALTGDDAVILRPQSAPDGVQASLRIDDDKGRMELHGMRAPEQGRVMQVWLMREGSTTPVPTDALFTPNRSGDASVAVPGDLSGVARVLVSEEPAGGSASPTTAPSVDFTVQSS
jgi:anti-sigma-K factor RskA